MWRKVVVVLSLGLLLSVAQAGILLGNPKGAVTLVEVMDYQCVHCLHLQPSIDWLIEHDSQLKVVVMPVPLINQRSLIEAASVFVLARHHGDVARFHHALIDHAANPLPIVRKLLHAHPGWVRELHQAWVKHQLDQGLALLQQAQSGTPLLLIGQTAHPQHAQVLRGEVSLRQLLTVIQEVSQ